MAEDRITAYQYAGLIGTATSQVMSDVSRYTASTAAATATNYQAGMSEASAGMTAAQMGIDAAMQSIMREQEQADLWYQSQSLKIDNELLKASADFASAEGEARVNQMLEAHNKSMANFVVNSVAQNRYGATIDNIKAQEQYKVQKAEGQVRAETAMTRSRIAAQQAQKIGDSEVARLAIESSKSTSLYEQESAKIGAEYTKKSAAVTAKLARSNAARAMKSANINLGLSVLSAAGSAYSGYQMRSPGTSTTTPTTTATVV